MQVQFAKVVNINYIKFTGIDYLTKNMISKYIQNLYRFSHFFSVFYSCGKFERQVFRTGCNSHLTYISEIGKVKWDTCEETCHMYASNLGPGCCQAIKDNSQYGIVDCTYYAGGQKIAGGDDDTTAMECKRGN